MNCYVCGVELHNSTWRCDVCEKPTCGEKCSIACETGHKDRAGYETPLQMAERHRTTLLETLKLIRLHLVDRKVAEVIGIIIDHCEKEAENV